MMIRLMMNLLVVWSLISGHEVLQTPSCPGAPLSRLEVGIRGEVAPGIDRLRLRMLPAVGAGEVRLLYSGSRFEVLAGPSCNGGFRWWRIVLDDGAAGWVAEGTWEEYYLRPLSDGPVSLCKRAETPWLHLIVTAACAFAGAWV